MNTPQPTIEELAAAAARDVAQEVSTLLDGLGVKLTDFEFNRLKKVYCGITLRHLQPLAKDREEQIEDAIRGLGVARKALNCAEICMGEHEMQDSKWDNARNLIYTAKVASHATAVRLRSALSTPKPASS